MNDTYSVGTINKPTVTDGKEHSDLYFDDLVYRPQKSVKINLNEEIEKLNERIKMLEDLEKDNSSREKEMLWTLHRLFKLWTLYPELRLGQLIGNALSDPQLYYVTDDNIVTILEKYYDNI